MSLVIDENLDIPTHEAMDGIKNTGDGLSIWALSQNYQAIRLPPQGVREHVPLTQANQAHAGFNIRGFW